MGQVIISYRGSGPGAQMADRLYTALCLRLGKQHFVLGVQGVFRPASNARVDIDDAMKTCEALIVMIDPQWLGDWLHNLDDHDRMAIDKALVYQRRVIPMLVNGATMVTPEQVPIDMSGFAQQRGVPLTDGNFDNYSEKLAKALSGYLSSTPPPAQTPAPVAAPPPPAPAPKAPPVYTPPTPTPDPFAVGPAPAPPAPYGAYPPPAQPAAYPPPQWGGYGGQQPPAPPQQWGGYGGPPQGQAPYGGQYMPGVPPQGGLPGSGYQGMGMPYGGQGQPPQYMPPQQPYGQYGMPPAYGYGGAQPPAPPLPPQGGPAFAAALGHPMSGQGGFSKVLIAALLMLIPIIGQLFVLGYGIRVARRVFHNESGLPEWNDLGGDFMRGLLVIVGMIVQGILYGVVTGAIMFVLITLFGRALDAFFVIYFLGGFIFAVLFFLTQVTSIANYAASDQFMDLLNIFKAWGQIWSRRGGALGLILNLFVFGFIGSILIGIGYFLLVCPGIIATAFVLIGYYYIIGRWAQRVNFEKVKMKNDGSYGVY